jgi:hypothetical protein
MGRLGIPNPVPALQGPEAVRRRGRARQGLIDAARAFSLSRGRRRDRAGSGGVVGQ